MQAAQIFAPDHARVIDAPSPEPGPGEVLIAVRAAGICGTDLHIFHGEYEATYPIIPGHEFSGVVAAVGPGVRRYAVEDRVTADPNIPCGLCPACQRNEPNQCHALAAVGVTRDGAFADYIVVPESVTFPIGDMSFAAAALVEPLACVVWGLQRVQVQPGDAALVFGAGPMGCLVVQALRHAGAAHVVVTDVVESRLALAAALGATHTLLAGDDQNAQLRALAPLGYDIVTDATGIPAVLEQCFDVVRPRGKIWVFGVCPPRFDGVFFALRSLSPRSEHHRIVCRESHLSAKHRAYPGWRDPGRTVDLTPTAARGFHRGVAPRRTRSGAHEGAV